MSLQPDRVHSAEATLRPRCGHRPAAALQRIAAGAFALALTCTARSLAAAPTLEPASVPANGRQDVLLTLDAPAAVHFSARSASGTACELIDRVRGPFARSGAAGSSNCEIDLLLDGGQYKIRLESSARGKGNVALAATPFAEINTSPLRLTDGVSVITKLKPGQQASYWLTVEAGATRPLIRIAGRHAGDVRLWRNGQWLEPLQIAHSEFSPMPGEPLHEWWLDTAMEPGEYRLVVYGRDSTTVTGPSVDDSLTIEYGVRAGPPERSVRFTLPPSGVFAVRAPSWKASTTAVLSLDAAPKSPVDLQMAELTSVRSPRAACRVEKNQLAPECSTVARVTGETVILVRGAPGTRGRVEWAEYRTAADGYKTGGYFGPTTSTLTFTGQGTSLVGVFDLPNDTDAAPLACQLQRVRESGTVDIVARSAVHLGDGEMLEREFNYDQNGAVVWFQIGGEGSLLERVGLSSRRYRIATSGGRKSTCEIYKVGDKGELARLTQSKPSGGNCDEVLALENGFYQLQLTGGLTGIEKLIIQEEGAVNPKKVAARGGCLLPNVPLSGERYRLVLNRVGAAVRMRGLTVEPLPLTGSTPLHFQLDANQLLEVPVRLSATATVRSAGAAPFGCALKRGKAAAKPGECALPAGADTLRLHNPGNQPINLTLSRPGGMAAFALPASYTPALKPLARIEPEAPSWLDFERQQSHSVLFDVTAPGLYNVTTIGLLATACRLRTPLIVTVAENQGGGRGRNCLIQTYLQQGRYMLTASTVGQSRGRGALLLTRQAPTELAGIAAEGEQYSRVDADQLVQQKLEVKTAGRYELGTTAQGIADIRCRLDDPDGWPVEAVPSPCTGARGLRPGTYLWTQLPLTVESMRHTRLALARDAIVLKGDAPHALAFFTWYQAQLGSDGKDELTFALAADTTLDVVLTNGMQGRVYQMENGKRGRPVDLIPPLPQPGSVVAPTPGEGETAAPEQRMEESAGHSEGEAGEASEGDGEGSGEALGEGVGAAEAPPPPPSQLSQPQAAPPPPSGVKLMLPAGEYMIVAEHSRGDVGIDYQVHLGTEALLPGMARTLSVPVTVPVLIPRDGTLRLRTDGEADVRCRLFDANGQLIFEGSDNGADWNCVIAEPIRQGRYRLVVESETQTSGETRVSLGLPALEDAGAVSDGMQLTLAEPVVSLTVPMSERDAVQELRFQAQGETPLACALEDANGMVVHRQTRTQDCTLLVRTRSDRFRVRLWTADGATRVVARLRTRPLIEGGKGEIAADSAVAIKIARPGRYVTAPQVFCIGAADSGLLRPCGPEASLEAGPTIFAALGTKPLPLDEKVFAAADAAIALPLTRLPYLQTVTSPRPALFLLEARVQNGDVAPSCAFDGAGSVREWRDTACFAASRIGTAAATRLWAPSDTRIDAQVIRRAVPVPERAEPLAGGRRSLTFAAVGRYALPRNGRTRIDMSIPGDSWAILLDDGGQARDLCAPTADLQHCVLSGEGGSLLLVSAAGRADVTTLALATPPRSQAFDGLYEAVPPAAGTLHLTVPAFGAERTVRVEGALHCTMVLADGTRTSDCRSKLPAAQAAELVIEHDTGPLRAIAYAPGLENATRLGREPSAASTDKLPAALAVPLHNGSLDRSFAVDREAVVRVTAEGGVCALLRGSAVLAVEGFGAGCEIVRVLPPDTYRLLVRPFAARPLAGLASWTAEPITQLDEGVGAEDWIAPGEVRLFRFDTANRGKAGLGIQAKREQLDCAVYDDAHRLLGTGCQQYLSLDKGRYLLEVRNPASAGVLPIAFKPVLLGLSGEKSDIPEAYLQDFFGRIGERP